MQGFLMEDNDHFDRLRHFYEKFGFEVSIKGTKGSIRLNLQEQKIPVIEIEDVIACCRGNGYSKLRSEYLLTTSREQCGK